MKEFDRLLTTLGEIQWQKTIIEMKQALYDKLKQLYDLIQALGSENTVDEYLYRVAQRTTKILEKIRVLEKE